MSTTGPNPKLHGALTLAELTPTLSVCVVNLEDKTYTRAEVKQLTREGDYTPAENYTYVLLLENGSLQWYSTSTLGVEADHQGEWTLYCLSEPDNPALEEFKNVSPERKSAQQDHPHLSMTGASWFFDNLQ